MAKTEGNERQLESQMLGMEVNSRTVGAPWLTNRWFGCRQAPRFVVVVAMEVRKGFGFEEEGLIVWCRVDWKGLDHVFVGANRREISLHLSRPALGEDSTCCRDQISIHPTGISALE